jgi:hypothetical protein
LDFQKNIALLVAIAAIFSGLLNPVFSIDFAFATSEEAGDNGGGDNGGGGDEPDPDPEPEPEPEPEPDPEPDPDPGFVGEPIDPCEVNPEAEGCTPEPPVDPCIENPSAEGCEPVPPPPGCSCVPGEGQACPDVLCEPPSPITPVPPPVPPCIEDPLPPECTPPPGEPCPPGYERISNDESGPCRLIPEENIYIDIWIITEINNQIKRVSTTPTSCTPQDTTIALGPGSIASKGVRVLAAFDPCILSGGGAVLNLPDSNNNLKLVAVDLEGDEMHKAVEVSLQKINTITDDQTFYNTQFTRSMTGMSPITDKIDTVQDINSLVLLNDSPGQIDFVSDNSMAFNAVLTPN